MQVLIWSYAAMLSKCNTACDEWQDVGIILAQAKDDMAEYKVSKINTSIYKQLIKWIQLNLDTEMKV